MASYLKTFTGDGSEQHFTADFPVLRLSDLAVVVNGSWLVLGVDYLVSGSTSGPLATLTAAPANGATVVLRSAVGYTPTDPAAVTTAAPNLNDTDTALWEAIGRGDALSLQAVADLAQLGDPAPSNGNSVAVTSYGSTTARLLSVRFADVVNAADYGALGNNSANDTAAIQAAVTAASGKTLIVPPGTYLLASMINLPASIEIRARGAIFKASAAHTNAVLRSATSTHTVIDGLEIHGNYDAGGAYYGIKMEGGTDVDLSGLYVHDTGQAGTWIDSVNGGRITRSRYVNCGRNFGTNDHGIMVGTSTNSFTMADWSFSDLEITGSHRKGLACYLFGTGAVLERFTLANIKTKDNGLGGVYVATTTAIARNFTIGNVASTGDGDSGGGAGVEITGLYDSAISNVAIREVTNGGNYAFYADGMTNVSISNVSTDGSKVHGIGLGIANANSGITVLGCTVTNPNQSAAGFGCGIIINNTTDSVVVGNKIIDPSGKMTHGISEGGTSNRNVFGLNHIKDAATASIVTVGAGTSVLGDASGEAVSSFGTNVGSKAAPSTVTVRKNVTGDVTLSGSLVSTSGTVTAGSTLCTLAAAYRPNRLITIPVTLSSGTVTYLNITTGGVVTAGANIVAGSPELPLAVTYRLTN